MTAAQLPIAFRVAQLVRGLPDFPGRDTILHALLTRDAHYPDGIIRGTFAGGLRYEGNPALDRNILELPMLRFGKPALMDVFDAALSPGDVFADVGANVGLYTLWGARRVGAAGQVHAFEPIPRAVAALQRNVEVNAFSQVEVNACAVGAESGSVRLHLMDLHTARSSRYVLPEGESLEVPLVSLDEHLASRRPPRLIKIDVEGMEFEVIRGAQGLLGADDPPLLVFEATADFFAAAGTSYREVVRFLADRGYGTYALAASGLRREPADPARPGAHNVLSVAEGHASHDLVLERLRRVRFPDNQNA